MLIPSMDEGPLVGLFLISEDRALLVQVVIVELPGGLCGLLGHILVDLPVVVELYDLPASDFEPLFTLLLKILIEGLTGTV